MRILVGSGDSAIGRDEERNVRHRAARALMTGWAGDAECNATLMRALEQPSETLEPLI